MRNPYDVLLERGLVQDCTSEEGLRKLFKEETVTAYVGYDPSGESLHVGNLLSLVMLRHLLLAGHRAIALVGGGTALVGDPSGKDSMRQMLTRDRIRANFERVRAQVEKMLDVPGSGELIVADNAEWLESINYIEFLRDVGKHFSVNRMLAAESYKLRMEKGLSFLEFNYQVLQAYDFLVLNRKHGCRLQMGGSDQWGNIIAGVELIRRMDAREAFGLVCPLLTTADGKKMGKTEKGAVWLDPEKVSPYEFFQYWRNVDDRDVYNLLKYYTFLPLEEIAPASRAEGAEVNAWKERLAAEVTTLVHGREEAEKALSAAREMFSGGGDAENIPTHEIAASELEAGYWFATALVDAGLCKSKGEAGRLVKQGGAYLNDEQVRDGRRELSSEDFTDGCALLRAGKKKYARVVIK